MSFGPRGRRLVTAGRSAVVSDARTGRRLLALRHPAGVLSASFSPDSSLIATTSPDRRVRLWDARTGSLIHVLPGSDPDTVSSEAAFDRSSRRLVTWGGGPAALIYDVVTGLPTGRLLHRGLITVARFSPTTDVVATGGAGQGRSALGRSDRRPAPCVQRPCRWRSRRGVQRFRSAGRNCKHRWNGTSVGSEVRHACRDPPGSHGLRHRARLQSRRRADRHCEPGSHGPHLRRGLRNAPRHAGRPRRGGEGRRFRRRLPDRRDRQHGRDDPPVERPAVSHAPAGREAGVARRGGRFRRQAHPQRGPCRRPKPSLRTERRPTACVPRAGLRGRRTRLSRSRSARARTVACSSLPIATARSESGGPTTSRQVRGATNDRARTRVLGSVTPCSASARTDPSSSRARGMERPAAVREDDSRLPRIDPGLTSATFSPDGRFVLTTSVDHDARLVDVQDGTASLGAVTRRERQRRGLQRRRPLGRHRRSGRSRHCRCENR